MTTLEIKPRWADKTARFKGTVAAGEVVAVTVKGAADWINEDALRLRIVNERGDTVAQFPVPDDVYDDETMPTNTWGMAGDENEDATCLLSLNTDQMRRCVPRGTRMMLFVLDDPTQGNGILYFKDLCEVTHWPDRTGEDSPAPIDFGNYRNFLREAQDAMEDAADRVEAAETQIAASAESATSAATAAAASQSAAEAAQLAIPAQVEAAITNADIPALVASEVEDQLEDKQDSLTDEQMAAVDSGITEEILETIQDDIEDLQSDKADATTVAAALATKANAADMETALANKVGNSALSAEVAARTSADSTLNAKITTLIGTDDNMSARSIAQQEVAKIVASADADFDTLKEVADWIKSDTTGAAKMQSDISDLKAGKVDKVTGKGLSTEDYTTVEKQKLAGVAANANAYVLPPASASTLGGVKVGANLSIDENGVLSATGGSSVTVDAALSTTSENPVQNKVVTAELAGKLSRAEAEAGFTAWTYTGLPPGAVITTPPTYVSGSSAWNFVFTVGSIVYTPVDYAAEDEDSTSLEWIMMPDDGRTPITVTATRTRLPTMADIPTDNAQLTNGAGYATTAEMAAALAPKADASSLPYALVSITPTPGAPFVLAACFPIVYTPEGGSAVTIAATDASRVGVIANYDGDTFIDYSVRDATENKTICYCNASGLYANASGTVTFNGTEPMTFTTPVLGGLTPTYALSDRAINVVSLSAAATLTMPAVSVAGRARDLVVRLAVGAADIGITWGTADAGGVAVDYETEDGNFPDLSEAGTYLVRLTETAAFAAGTGGAADVPAKFLIQCQPLQTAAAGGGQ